MVGKTLGDISGQEIIVLEFYDYLGNAISPNRTMVKRTDSETQFVVEATSHARYLGKTGDTEFQARWVIADDKMVVRGPTSSPTSVITEVYNFMMQELTTNERSYTKFKYTY